MERDELLERLRSYKRDAARREHLTCEIQDMAIRINRAAVAETVLGSGGGNDGMPKGGKISKPAERAALLIADGVVPERVLEWQGELETMQAELGTLERRVRMIDRAMSALNEMERVVVEMHEMEGVSWAELEARSRRLFGVDVSRNTLRNRRRDALDMMLEVLR